MINYEPLNVRPGIIEHNEYVNKSYLKFFLGGGVEIYTSTE